MEYCKEVERTIITTYRKSIWRKFLEAVEEFDLIQQGDRIAVCITGDKDSLLLAKCMQEFKRHGDSTIELVFFVLDSVYDKQECLKIIEDANAVGVTVTVTSCVKELNCNKMALCHHFNNIVETILLGMLYNGQVQTMMPKSYNLNYEGIEVIRPLYLVKEEAILRWSERHEVKYFPCEYAFAEDFSVCEEDTSRKRKNVKELIDSLRLINPNIDVNIFKSMYNVNLDTMISYVQGKEVYHFLDNYDS